MYRDVRALLQAAERVQDHLTNAILAEDTAAIAGASASAQAVTNDLLRALKTLVDSGSSGYTQTDPAMLQSALACLNDAWTGEEKVALEVTTRDMRARAVSAKTAVDYAKAYLQAALGHQDVTR